MMNQACKDYVLKLLAYGAVFSQLNITGTLHFCLVSALYLIAIH